MIEETEKVLSKIFKFVYQNDSNNYSFNDKQVSVPRNETKRRTIE